MTSTTTPPPSTPEPAGWSNAAQFLTRLLPSIKSSSAGAGSVQQNTQPLETDAKVQKQVGNLTPPTSPTITRHTTRGSSSPGPSLKAIEIATAAIAGKSSSSAKQGLNSERKDRDDEDSADKSPRIDLTSSFIMIDGNPMPPTPAAITQAMTAVPVTAVPAITQAPALAPATVTPPTPPAKSAAVKTVEPAPQPVSVVSGADTLSAIKTNEQQMISRGFIAKKLAGKMPRLVALSAAFAILCLGMRNSIPLPKYIGGTSIFTYKIPTDIPLNWVSRHAIFIIASLAGVFAMASKRQ